MTIPKEIIELAIKGGCNMPSHIDESMFESGDLIRFLVLSPSFWSGLGKSLGWQKGWRNKGLNNSDISTDLYNALSLFNLILQEKPTDQFWQDIINNK